jgi:rare lipoprotein A
LSGLNAFRVGGTLAVVLSAVFAGGPVFAKSPGTKYCFGGWCHRVGTLDQTATMVGWRGYLLASYYDDCHRDRLNPCGLTSSGAVFRPDMPDNAASPLFPDGTIILAYNPKTEDAAVLRVTSAGPYSGQRKLDVSRASAERLGFKNEGTAHLVVSVLKSPTMEEATYVKRRVYPAVPGHIGKYESYDLAYEAALARLAIEMPDEGDVPAASAFQHASLRADEALIVRPRRAVSPYLAKELTVLRVPPRPVPRLHAEDESEPAVNDTAQEAPAVPQSSIDFGYRLRAFVSANADN